MSNTRPDESFLLKVRHRQVLQGNGDSSTESIVSCRRRGGGVPLATCMACEHATGHQNDGSGRCSYLLCRVRPEGFEAAVRKRSVLDVHCTADRTPVAAVMTGDVLCVREDVSIESLSALFIQRGISGAPVVDAHGFPIGVVSKTDLVRERYENGESVDAERLGVEDSRDIESEIGNGFHSEPMARATVGDIMTPLAFTLYEQASLSQAAALMAFEGVHRVPVVSDDGHVVGILSSLDVMQWLAHLSPWKCE